MICYDYIDDYLRNTVKRTDGILKELEIYAKENHVPIIQPEVARLLSVLCSIQKPYRILEIGTAIGYSSILMAANLSPNGRMDTIERYDVSFSLAKDNIKKAGLSETINVILGDALEVLPCLDKKYDMIFLDAAKGQYIEFLPDCMRMLNIGGLLISDNVLYRGMTATDSLVIRRQKTIVTRMREYLDFLCNMKELETSIIPIGDGMALSYRK